MKNLLRLVAIVLISNNLNAQLGKQIDAIFPSSPEATAMAEYAKIPVDLYTGVAQINLPLMKLKGKDFDLPISISYHSAGNKVNEESSQVGLGWVLNAGGVITRSVRGLPDDHKPGEGYVGVNNRGQKITANFASAGEDTYMGYALNNYDAQPDEYFFNFLGKSGRFTINSSQEIIMTPEQDFVITPIFDSLGQIEHWKVLDKGGVEYKFGVLSDDRERSRSTFTFGQSVSSSDFYNSSWFLSSISTPNGDAFSFEYDKGGAQIFETELEMHTNSGNSSGFGTALSKLEVSNVVYLTKITSRYGTINVTNLADRQDQNNGRRIEKLTLINHSGGFVKDVMFNHSYFDSKENCSDVECKRLKLESVDEQYKFEKSIGKYAFQYNGKKLPRRDSPELDHWGYYNENGQAHLINHTNPSTVYQIRTPNENAAKANILERITYSTGGYTQFYYGLNEWYDAGTNRESGGLRIERIENNDNQGNSIFTDYDYAAQGGTSSSGQQYSLPSYQSTYSWVDSQWRSFAGAATETYKIFLSAQRINSFSLRNLFDLNGAAVTYGQVTVEYADGSTEVNKYTDLVSHGDVQNASDYFRTYSHSSSSGVNTSIEELTSLSGPPWGPPSYRNMYQRGMLSEKVVKDPLGNKTYQLNNSYEVDDTNLKEAYGYAFYHIYTYVSKYDSDGNGPIPETILFLESEYYVSRYLESNRSYRLTQSVEKTFDGSNELTNTVDYTYTNSKPTLVKTQTTTFSNGDEGKVSYTYPFELSGTTNTAFTQNNQIADYIDKYDYINNVQVGYENRVFAQGGYYTNNGGTPLPQKTNFKKKNLATYSNLTVERYDSYGNVLQYRGNDGVPVSIIWGYGNRYPVAKVVNATYDEATDTSIGLNMLNINGSNPSPSSLRAEIDKIRDHVSMSEARVTGYTYSPLIGVTSITDSRGYLSTYEYDDFNRLQFVKDQDGHLLTENIYQYENQYNGNGSSATQLQVIVTYTGSSYSYQDFVATASGGTGNYTYKWYRGIGTSSTNFESTPAGSSSTFRLNVSCNTYRYVKLITTSGGLTSTRIIRSNNNPCSNDDRIDGGDNQQ